MHDRHSSRRRRTFLAGGLIATLATASLIAATIQPAPAAPKGPKSAVGSGIKAIAPAGKSHLDTVKGYLKSRGAGSSTLSSVKTDGSAWTYRGVTHVRLQQRVNGLRVYGGEAKASFNRRGELIHIVDFTVKVSDPKAARTGARGALRAASKSLYPKRAVNLRRTGKSGATTTYARGSKYYVGPRVEKVAVPTRKGLAVGYLVDTWDAKSNKYYSTLVSGTGSVIAHELRTAKDSYNVFTQDPDETPQAVVPGPGNGNDESPGGWLFSQLHTSTNITGNNVHAYLDSVSDNKPDAGGDPITGGNFLSAFDENAEPTTEDNREVAVQNLFYLNNVIHDTLYAAGFVEGAGNFQEKNFVLKNGDSDSVNAEAQDGGGIDNANFATPPDGVNPRMQMYLWTGLGTHNVVVHATGGDVTYLAQGAAWGGTLDTTGETGELAVAADGTAPASDGCEALVGDYTGKIVVADRGTCNFTAKAKNAQNAGAVGVIVANNNGSAPFTMGGADASVTIPAVMVSLEDGNAIKAAAGTSTTIKLADVQPLQRDGDLDADIVWHEYGHGLTWRMIGKMNGPLAGAIGEGMGDVLALIADEDDTVGEYSTSDPFGIRSEPYDDYSLTYGDIIGTEVHADGEVYAAIGWRLLEHYQGAGIDKSVLLADLVDGMNYTPREPSFEEMRDGILTGLAASGNDGRACMVWDAFAEYGVGVGAHGVANGKTATTVESFDLPAACQS